ncbi:hypothetical protein MRB53_007415 [Persea americana]|uniref:Uncharacterized protein n=1 Tax=Persea americana TaxID=3435 RepID=A0ACC2MIX5_PERAE|nr:hypothetical protein MRB53_007415 [Persea americana]
MQSSLHTQISWKTPRFHRSRWNSNPKTLISATSLKSPFKFDLEEISPGGNGPAPVHLPVVIRKSGRVSRYLWDGSGNSLRLVPFDREESSGRFDLGEEVQRLVATVIGAVRKLFVPRKVNGNYMGYLKWKFLHRVFSSALQVLATQAMFRAIGIGSSRSLPSAAALNWVLKDGLGRLSRCIYTASAGSAFDTNLKRVRFSTSVLFSLSIGIEFLTPAFPEYFLLLATIANVAKSISLAAYIATGSAIHRSFAIVDNLGEVSAKAQIQTVCFDNLGLMLAAILNILCTNSQRLLVTLPLVVYPIFAAIDLFAIYQGLKHVHLQTLTKDRLEIIIDEWIRSGLIPSPAKVSCEEGVLFSRKVKFGSGSKLWPIRIGCIDGKDLTPKFSVLTMQSLTCEDFYFICMETSYRGLIRKRQQAILLCLREKAGTADVVMGLLQACLIRKALVSRAKEECKSNDGDAPPLLLREWFKVVGDSKRNARDGINLLMEEIQRTGWAIKNILLNSQEQIRYSLVDD